MSLRARGGSTAAARRAFFPEIVQLSTTDIFCRKMENTVLLSTVFRVYPKSRILDFSDVVLNSTTFSIFRQKLSVVLNCTSRSEKSLREAAVERPRARRDYSTRILNEIWVFTLLLLFIFKSFF